MTPSRDELPPLPKSLAEFWPHRQLFCGNDMTAYATTAVKAARAPLLARIEEQTQTTARIANECAMNRLRAEKAEAEVERLRADAERYQWLRGPLVGRGIRVIMPTPYTAILSGKELDAEIDAALKEQT
jgi:hypothetical protein